MHYASHRIPRATTSFAINLTIIERGKTMTDEATEVHTTRIPDSSGIPANSTPTALIAQPLLEKAIESGNVDVIEKLVAMAERERADQRRQLFNAALGKFQSKRPAVIKRRKVEKSGGTLLYKHANTDDITRAIALTEQANGFSHRFDFEPQEKGGCNATCIITHVAGHEERTTVTIPATSGQNTNAAQNRGIEIQYGMKYALCAAYGISLGDEDTDGNVPIEPITAEQVIELGDAIRFSGSDMSKVLEFGGNAPSLEQFPATHFKEAMKICNVKADRRATE